MNELKRFPLVPWPRPFQVQSLFSSLPMEAETFSSRNDKQLLSTDINGNPFSRSSRSSNLASFVSSTLMDYSNGSIVSEGKNRKKRLKNAGNKPVLSEEIAGHRGEEDIDTLLQFINSSDKKGKTPTKGNATNQILGSKNSLLHENDRKKSFSKDIKNCNKNIINSVKKKLTRSNSLENISSSCSNDVSDVFTFQARALATDIPLRSTNAANLENSKNLDINSNEENKVIETSDKGKDSSTDDSSLHNSIGRSSPDISSFAADFYSTADVSSQTQAVEESGFLIVKKKQRKKHQGKRSDSYRWRTTQTQRKKGIMLPLADSKCGKQDSRRKSTSSVPHSEHSSADNSDLDSVHSLPVRGSVPHPTQPHPHTTPSSSSSTPQASYADIARMPISKLHSSPSTITYNAQASAKLSSNDQETKRSDNFSASVSSTTKRCRASEQRESTSSSKSSPHSITANKEMDSPNVPDMKFRSFAKSTREINTQTEPENIVDISKIDSSMVKFGKKLIEESPKNGCSLCSIKKNTCSCPKPQRQKSKSIDIPPVIMDNMPSESDACNVSFGFGVDEVLMMSPVKCDTTSVHLYNEDNLGEVDSNSEEDYISSKNVLKFDGISKVCSVNTEIVDANEFCLPKSSSTSDVISKTIHPCDLPDEQSSHLSITLRSSKKIYFKDTKVNIENFNYRELINYFQSAFTEAKECKGTSKCKTSSKAKYYVDSSEEA